MVEIAGNATLGYARAELAVLGSAAPLPPKSPADQTNIHKRQAGRPGDIQGESMDFGELHNITAPPLPNARFKTTLLLAA